MMELEFWLKHAVLFQRDAPALGWDRGKPTGTMPASPEASAWASICNVLVSTDRPGDRGAQST